MGTVGPVAGEQLGFEGMPRRLFACTPSRLGTFADCPRRYRLTYLDRPGAAEGPAVGAQLAGRGVHNALRDWWLLPLAPAYAGGAPGRCWTPPGSPTGSPTRASRALAGRGRRDWAGARTWRRSTRRDEPVGWSAGSRSETERLALSGRVDRIDRRDGELVIVDYKTGRCVPDTDDARGSLALALYALAARRTLRRPVPPGRAAPPADRPGRRLRAHRGVAGRGTSRRAEDTADDIEAAAGGLAAGGDPDALFPPLPGPAVRVVRLPAHCPEGGRRAGAGAVVRARRGGGRAGGSDLGAT